MRIVLIVLILLTTLYSCGQSTEKEEYPRQVGDTSFDKKTDDSNFKVCNEERVFQYYSFGKGLQYKGEKAAINQYFKEKLKTKELKGESGFLTIRFIVNCEGKTGWFRFQGMDNDYKEKVFDKELVQNILTLTQQLDGWIIGGDAVNKVDYYQYLTFKIEHGKLIEIMP